MISFRKFLENNATLFQVKIGREWHDNVDLGVSSLQQIYNEVMGDEELDLHSLHADPESLAAAQKPSGRIIAFPKIHKMVLNYYASSSKTNKDFFDEESDYWVSSLKNDVLVIAYRINIRLTGSLDDYRVSGSVTVMPQN